MLNRLLEDLRFVIGGFFGMVGLILIVIGYSDPSGSIRAGENMNLVSGWMMAVFAAFMLFLVFWDFRKTE